MKKKNERLRKLSVKIKRKMIERNHLEIVKNLIKDLNKISNIIKRVDSSIGILELNERRMEKNTIK